MRSADVLQSGGYGVSTSSARAGYLPICLERAPEAAFEGIDVYLRTAAKGVKGASPTDADGAFHLYCATHVNFAQGHRQRLIEHGVKFVYIRIVDQERFRQQTEAQLLKSVEDPSIAVSVKSEMVYETSVELMNELLADPNIAAQSPRLEKISRAVTTLVLNDATSFSHLFAASHHDFYTATHMVNVGTWMVPLAYALGHHDVDELNHICQAGMLHDIGKIHVPSEVLNKPGKLTDEDWAMLRRHPELGCQHLEQYERIHPLVYTVTRQHHERMDGTGYPDRLTGDQMHPISRICAVVDSFDAMTAFRPFKSKTMTVDEALDILIKETPSKYDPVVMDAWIGMLRKAEKVSPATAAAASALSTMKPVITPKAGPITITSPASAAEPAAAAETSETEPAADDAASGKNLRRFPRFAVHCPGRVHVLATGPSGLREKLGIPIVAHNVSQSGAGFLSQTPINPGEQIRIYLNGSKAIKKSKDGLAVRCRTYRDGWYEMGIEFAMAESLDSPMELLAK